MIAATPVKFRGWAAPLLAASTLLLLAGIPAWALPPLYSPAELEQARSTYAPNLRAVWQQDLLGQLSSEEYAVARQIDLQLPLEGQERNPFDFHAHAASKTVVVPILSVRFFDDLAIAYAWLERRGCAAAPAIDYVGILRYRSERLSTGQGLLPPLAALGIDREAALADDWVNRTAGNALKSAIYFIMAHELGHVLRDHRRTERTPMAQAQREEIEADAFALDVMRRISVPPLGMVLWFTSASRLEPAPADFPTAAEYRRSLGVRSHPLTANRLATLARGIEASAAQFSALQSDPAAWRSRMVGLAREIAQTGDNLDDRDMRDFQRRRSLTLSVGDLRSACN